jgi:hypothetical protein
MDRVRVKTRLGLGLHRRRQDSSSRQGVLEGGQTIPLLQKRGYTKTSHVKSKKETSKDKGKDKQKDRQDEGKSKRRQAKAISRQRQRHVTLRQKTMPRHATIKSQVK